jgi:hypothetical protein
MTGLTSSPSDDATVLKCDELADLGGLWRLPATRDFLQYCRTSQAL